MPTNKGGSVFGTHRNVFDAISTIHSLPEVLPEVVESLMV